MLYLGQNDKRHSFPICTYVHTTELDSMQKTGRNGEADRRQDRQTTGIVKKGRIYMYYVRMYEVCTIVCRTAL